MEHDGGLHRRDAILPAVVLLVAAVEAVAFGPPRLALVLLLETAGCAALLLRRRHPVVAPAASLAPVLALGYLGPAVDDLAAPILVSAVASFCLGQSSRDLRGLLPLVVFALAILGAYETSPDVTDVVFLSALLLPPFAFGRVARALALRNAQLAEQAELLLQLQGQVRQEAVRSERSRIARELHDVIAHSVSAMVVQATAGEELVHRDPERAALAMRQVATTGRRALAETGRLLHLIRDSADELGVAPDLGLERLHELVEQFRRDGLDVELSVDGSLTALPAGVDVSGYRIVQEALTNALKHAADRAARLRVTRTATLLEIDAENVRGPGGVPGSGLGLVGMAERVQVFGGQLTHRCTGDRFVLSARLPLTAEP